MTAILQKVVLVGASGRLGPYILKALQANTAFDVTVVSRQSSSANFPRGTKVVKVSDSYPKSEFLDVFKGQDAVVLSLSYAAENKHHDMLVDASVEAGVKRLIPSLWGGRLDLPKAHDIFPFAASKAQLFEYVKSKSAPGWSYTAVATGLFMDLCVQTGFFGLDANLHSAKIWGDGNTKFSATNMDDIGRAVIKILSKPDETANKSVYISSFEPSLNDLLAAYKEATGVSEWIVVHGQVEQGIKEAQETSRSATEFMDKMRAIGRLALLVGLTEDSGADFVAEGLSDNDLLEIPRGSLTESVKKNLKF